VSKQIGQCRFLIFFSENTDTLGTKLGRHVHWIVLKKFILFLLIGKAKMEQEVCCLFWYAEHLFFNQS